MSFNDKEISNQEGRIIGLYKFQWGNTIWRYTSADRDITYNENGTDRVYTAVTIFDNGMTQGGDQANDFTVTAQSDLPLVGLFRSTPPSGSIYLTCRHKHFDEADAPVFWIGTVGNVKGTDDATAEIIGRTLTSSFKRSGLRLSWQKNCPHILYDRSCRVNPEAFGVAGVVTAKTGNTITVSGGAVAAYAQFPGGFVKWQVNVDGTSERRGIESANIGGIFTLYGRTDRLDIGTAVTLYPGCNHATSDCFGRFNNLSNYGGFEFLPNKSPFDGTPVF